MSTLLNPIARLLITSLIFLSTTALLMAGEQNFTKRLAGTDVAVSEKMEVEDPLYTDDLSLSNIDLDYETRVRLIYGREQLTDADTRSAWTLKVGYTVYFPGSMTTVEDTLTIGTNTNAYEALEVFDYSEGEVELTIDWMDGTPGSAGIPEDIRLELELFKTRVEDISMISGFDADHRVDTNTLTIYWEYYVGAEEYELQWVFIDDEDDSVSVLNSTNVFDHRYPSGAQTLKIHYKEPSNITTPFQHFGIHLSYPEGKIYYRVRPLGRFLKTSDGDYKFVKYGDWITVGSYTVSSPFEDGHNWQQVVSYAEDGKNKSVISYFDGSMRNRQSLTNLSTDNLTLIAETKYDYEGRNALNILPAPKNGLNLEYHTAFNQNGSASVYDKANFDLDASPAALNTSVGSGKYYSPNNDIEQLNQDYIPDADGYAFTQTTYTRDGTNRVATESGLGEDHIKGSGRETEYHYGGTNETELHRLFGTNVGIASHYKKNLIIDANNQINVSYMDQEGRVIATALAGDSPDNLNILDENVTEPITVSFNGNNKKDSVNFVSKSVNKILNVVPGTNYTFYYDLRGVLNYLAEPFEVCQTCVYNLEIKVTDPTGKVLSIYDEDAMDSVTAFIRTIRANDGYNCAQDTFPMGVETFTMDLPKIGNYTVTKTLRLAGGAIDAYLAALSDSLAPLADSLLAQYLGDIDSSFCAFSCSQQYGSPCRDTLKLLYGDATWASFDSITRDSLITVCIDSNCNFWADSAIVQTVENSCESILGQMEYSIRPRDEGGFQYNWWNSAINIDTVQIKDWDTDSSKFTPGIAMLTDPDTFQVWWIDQLVQYHREYCHYEACTSNKVSEIYDVQMSMVQTYADAQSAGDNYNGYAFMNPVPPSPDATSDPYFQSAEGSCYLDSMHYNIYTDYRGTGMALWELVEPGSGAFDSSYVGLTTPEEINDKMWTLWRGIYQGLKKEYQSRPCSTSCPYFSGPNAIVKPTNSLPTDAGEFEEFALGGASEYIHMTCESSLDGWYYILANSCDTITRQEYDDSLSADLFEYCINHTGFQNPLGFILADDTLTDPNLINVKAFLDRRGCSIASLVTTNAYDTLFIDGSPATQEVDIIDPCFIALVEFFNRRLYEVDSIPHLTLPSSKFEPYLDSCYGGFGGGYPASLTGRSYYESYGGHIQVTTSSCVSGVYFYDSLGNGLDSIQEVFAYYYTPSVHASLVASILSSRTYQNIKVQVQLRDESIVTAWVFTDTLNGTSCPQDWTYKDTVIIIAGPSDSLVATSTVTYNPQALQDSCLQSLVLQAEYYAAQAYQDTLDALLTELYGELNNCFKNPFKEDFYCDYILNEYHYTLYYYDQAGNLIQTVPPAGVDILTSSAFTKGVYDGTTEPDHRLESIYKYNSINQVTWQSTPDAGETYFYYDSKGQLKISQNAEQALHDHYSFTGYDDLGRIVTVGKIEADAPTTVTREMLDEADYTGQFFTSGSSGTTGLTELTLTAYDNRSWSASGFNGKNLRGRIGSTVYFEDWESAFFDGEFSTTNYSYDAHGNVDRLRQNINGFGSKEIDYEYDLVSGNVNEVWYQKGAADQFIHQYQYDADNRITHVFTSQDDRIWEEDARYFYYAHGPLARVELGEDKVQGLDYYYSIHGWLKGVNMPDVDHYVTDPGSDGNTGLSDNLNKWAGRDEMAFSLGYFDGDYDPIGTSVNLGANATAWTDFDDNIKQEMTTTTKGLFNGNITWMMTKIPELNRQFSSDSALQTMVYQYDQLNRITQTKSYQHWDGTDWDTRTSASTGPYDATYAYDPNGNLLTLTRRTSDGSGMDDMNYKYDWESSGYSGWLESNRLYYVDEDPGLSSVESTDYDAFGSYTAADADVKTDNNYVYDEIGNLTKDLTEEIDTILWTVYGKVSEVIRSAVSTKDDLKYLYDASGNRMAKIAKPKDGSGNLKDEDEWVTTYYVRDASGNIMATYTKSYTATGASNEYEEDISLNEYHLFGSSRLGVKDKDVTVLIDTLTITGFDATTGVFEGKTYTGTETQNGILSLGWYGRTMAEKKYELSNHLGNVLAVVSDQKQGVDTDVSSDQVANHYLATVLTASDYYPFGMIMPGRSANSDAYRFTFQGQEQDVEWTGSGSHLAFMYRIHDTRLGRFLSVDPLKRGYPYYSPYQFAGNSVIAFIDLEGREPAPDDLSYGKHIMFPSISPYEAMTNPHDPTNENWTISKVSSFSQMSAEIECIKSTSLSGKVFAVYIQTHGGSREDGTAAFVGGSLSADPNFDVTGGNSDFFLIETMDIERYLEYKANGKEKFLSDNMSEIVTGELTEWLDNEFKTIEAIDQIMSMVEDGGSIIFGGCDIGADPSLLKALYELSGGRLKILGSQSSVSAGVDLTSYPDIRQPSLLNTSLMKGGLNRPGWRTIGPSTGGFVQSLREIGTDMSDRIMLQGSGEAVKHLSIDEAINAEPY